MINAQPIGIFDSGVGGTSIWKEIISLLKYENTIYLADSQNAPYGEKSTDEIQNFCIKNTEKLLNLGAKLIVVACNTATTTSIQYLRNNYPISFIGIEPAIKPAALKTKTKNIGVLATRGTLSSALFAKTSDTYAKHINVIEVVGEGLVPLIEDNKLKSERLNNLLKIYLQPMIDQGIDYLVLGCSHYPYLTPHIKEILPKNVIIIDSGEAVARQTKSILLKNNLLNSSKQTAEHTLYTNTNTTTLTELLSQSAKGYKYNIEFMKF